jgi:hypothetical protein
MKTHRHDNPFKFLQFRQERIFDKNNDCEGFVLQDERGPRYGNKRKYVARDKTLQRRQDRVDRKRQMEAEIKEEDIFP